MNTYSDNNPPKSGTAKKIYDVFKKNGWKVVDLHYNENCWGRKNHGEGSWVCNVWGIPDSWGWGATRRTEYLCGIVNGNVYLQQASAPFSAWDIGKVKPTRVYNKKKAIPRKYIWNPDTGKSTEIDWEK